MPTPYRETVAAKPMLGGVLIIVLSLPILLNAIVKLAHGKAFIALASAAGFGLLILAAWLVRKGKHYEFESNKRKWVRATRVPWRLLAAFCCGGAALLVAWFAAAEYQGFFSGIGFGVAAAIGCALTYGLDPQYSNGDTVSQFGVAADEVVDLLEEAEGKIAAIETANKNIHNPELTQRLDRITAKTRDILRVIEEDPRDAKRARKFIKVYLDGAQKVTEGYARAHKQDPDNVSELESNFRNVLETIETTTNEQHQKLLENDKWDLDVQIEVLETQLKREGIL